MLTIFYVPKQNFILQKNQRTVFKNYSQNYFSNYFKKHFPNRAFIISIIFPFSSYFHDKPRKKF